GVNEASHSGRMTGLGPVTTRFSTTYTSVQNLQRQLDSSFDCHVCHDGRIARSTFANCHPFPSLPKLPLGKHLGNEGNNRKAKHRNRLRQTRLNRTPTKN